MIRFGSLLVFVASMGLVAVTDAAYADDVRDGRIVLAIYRSAGYTIPERMKPMDQYQFTVVKDGSWEFRPQKGQSKTGKLGAEELDEWLEAIEDGLDEVHSSPTLGALDDPFMDIAVQTRDGKAQVRISVVEELAQAIQRKIVEVAKPSP